MRYLRRRITRGDERYMLFFIQLSVNTCTRKSDAVGISVFGGATRVRLKEVHTSSPTPLPLRMPTEILVVGAGAIGAFFASRLALAPSVRVSCVLRSAYNAVRTSGFRLTSSSFGSYTFHPTRIFRSSEEARQRTKEEGINWAYILVATKALPDVSDQSELLDGLVKDGREGTSIVLIQNGLGVEDPYAARFPGVSVLSGVTIASTTQTAPGEIWHHKWTGIQVGPWLPGFDDNSEHAKQKAEASETFVQLLKGGGIKDAEAVSHTKLQQKRWHKVAVNAAMNPTSVLAGGCDNATLTNDAELQVHVVGVMREVMEAATRILGCEFRVEDGFAKPEQVLRTIQKSDPGSRPSMWQDWDEGRPMETEVILGNPLRIAKEYGIDMPRVQSLYALVKMAQENRNRARNDENKGKL